MKNKLLIGIFIFALVSILAYQQYRIENIKLESISRWWNCNVTDVYVDDSVLFECLDLETDDIMHLDLNMSPEEIRKNIKSSN